jgi:DNA modification methylase
VWDKDNGKNDFADCELAWCSFNKAVRKFLWRWHGMLQENMANKEIRYHRNQKPVGLMKQIIERYSKPSDLILDCFTGSGSIPVAAELMGRMYIGIELSETYCEIARKRVRDAKDQFGLFNQ